MYDGGWSDKKSGVFPSKFARDYRNPDLWFWVQLSCIYDGDSDGVPLDIDFSPKIGELFEYFFTPESAIIALLDGWADAEAAGHQLPTATVGIIG